ncbi:MAG: type IV pilin protein [Gammaproteobacteria bacterium]|nr:type IV pilin protein [Gammaproteobacteria bacterium]
MKNSKQTGFSLIELMVVVAIIGILTMLVYPNYQSSVIKTNRSQAKVALEGLAAAMERYYSENSSYAGANFSSAGGSITVSNHVPKDGTDKYYVLSITSATAQAFSLKATAQAGTPQANNGNLTLGSTGARTWGEKSSWQD